MMKPNNLSRQPQANLSLNPGRYTFSKQKIGKQGENIAVQFLKKQGYIILDRNFRARPGELDIVAIFADTLIFVEVKTRIGLSFGLPEEAITPRKLREIIKTSQFYKYMHPQLPDAMRIDVIAIVLSETGNAVSLRHIKSITS